VKESYVKCALSAHRPQPQSFLDVWGVTGRKQSAAQV